MNLSIFQNPYEFFLFFFTFLKKKLKILENERDVTNLGYVFFFLR